ncbi:MAG: FtsW/RodA/SpoVE family cell cycle protein [Lachnospiraceae bacterium]
MTGKKKRNKLFDFSLNELDTNLIVVTMFLIVFGLIMVYSASYYKCSMSKAYGYDSMAMLKNQALLSCVGFGVMLLVSSINYHLWKKKPIVILAVLLSIGLTLLLKVPSLSITANGATRWVKFGPISFQVAEPVKIAVIVSTAYLISKIGADERKWRVFSAEHWKNTIKVLIPGVGLAGFLGIISSNMSSAIIIVGIACLMYFELHPKYWPFVLMIILALLAVGILIYLMSRQTVVDAEGEGFRLTRIRAWLDPYAYEGDKAFQNLQALYAIGSGGLFGKGLGNSIQKLGSIPEPYNDFIFAIVCEELGIVGASLLMLLFIYLLYRIFIIAQQAEDLFGRMLAGGVFCHIALQVVLNIAVVTATIPNTGVTLPFISYGGTATIFLLVEIGMVLNVQKWGERKRLEEARELREAGFQ